MEKRGIIYTFAANTDLDYCQHYHQILYSIETIRKFSDIPVKIFMSPRGAIGKATMKADQMFSNVQVIEFDNDIDALYPTYIFQGYAEKLDHRWINVMKSFELWDFDRVLFLDGDTFFNRSPDELFNKYTNTKCLWARLDVTSGLMKQIGIPDGINDGQFILSRDIFNKVNPNFRERHRQNVFNLLSSTESKLDALGHKHLHWLSSQYAALTTLAEFGVYVGYFSTADVTLSTEPCWKHGNGDCTMTSIMHHYFFGNTPRYLPRRYWSKERYSEFDNVLQNQTLCTQCGNLS
jgi:hypothetical protein